MIVRVLTALAASGAVGSIRVVGLPPEAAAEARLAAAMKSLGATSISGGGSPSRSVELALAGLPADRPVLVTTADHALLEARYVDSFLAAAREIDADVAIGLARADTVMAAVPGTRRTITRFSDGSYCGVNLFAFLTPAGRSAVRVWREVEAHRKRPARMMRLLGLGTLLRFALGRLSLDAALGRLSALADARVAPVVLSYGRAAIDVDKPEDLALVRRLATAPGQAAAVDPPAEPVPDPMSDRG